MCDKFSNIYIYYIYILIFFKTLQAMPCQRQPFEVAKRESEGLHRIKAWEDDGDRRRVRTPEEGFDEVIDVRSVIFMEIMLPEESLGSTGVEGNDGE